jgi:hypothetical protein
MLLSFTMLPRDNLFADENNAFVIRNCDIHATRSGLFRRVKSVKNNRLKDHTFDLPVPRIPGNTLCPTQISVFLNWQVN